jgi:uncharacterized membrane protein
MQALLQQIAAVIALSVEALGVLIIAGGAVEAAWGAFRALAVRTSKRGQRKDVWLRFAVWLLLGLEFELASDIIRTAISPSWTDLGQLAAIAVIRTFLNYFLEKDQERYEPNDSAIKSAEPTPAS